MSNEFAHGQNEAKVKVKVKRILAEVGAWYCMPRGTVLGRSGVPDFLVCLHGRFIGIETKSGSNKPTALQAKELLDIERHHGMTFVVNERTLPEFEQKIKLLARAWGNVSGW